MKLLNILINTLLIVPLVKSFDCSVEELKKYNFEKIKGTHTIKVEKDTPPSKTEITWNIGVCEDIKDVDECKDSQLCGLTKVTVDKTSMISEIIKVDSKNSIKILKNSGKLNNENGVLVSYEDFKWGDETIKSELKFICPSKGDEDKLDEFVIDKWDNKNLKLSMKTKSACISKKSGHKDNKHEDTGDSWGWFTWIFIFFVLFLSIYIIGGAWFQYNKGNSIDFQTALKEVVENFVEVVKGLPIFIKEIVEKFTGNSNRGEYSAV